MTATLHDVGIRCDSVDMNLSLLRFQLHFTCSATLFLSFEVRACCDSAVDFTGKKVVSIVVIFAKLGERSTILDSHSDKVLKDFIDQKRDEKMNKKEEEKERKNAPTCVNRLGCDSGWL